MATLVARPSRHKVELPRYLSLDEISCLLVMTFFVIQVRCICVKRVKRQPSTLNGWRGTVADPSARKNLLVSDEVLGRKNQKLNQQKLTFGTS